MSLKVGQEAPDFSATAVYDQEFKEITLSGLRGKWVVLFFYPLDFTFVCPTESTAFSDRYQDFSALNTVIQTIINLNKDKFFHELKSWPRSTRL